MVELNGRRLVTKLCVWANSHLVLILISITVCALILFPIADCFDCQYQNAWGRNDATYEIRSIVFDCWLVGASFSIGILRRRWGWLVPVAIVLIGCATEPLGGVPLWSLINNEGPMMLLIGGIIGLISFFIGTGLRILFGTALRMLLIPRPGTSPTNKSG